MCRQDELNIILKKIAELAKDILKEKLDSAILYGSYARGDFDEESDIDIIILADVPREDIHLYKKNFISLTAELGLEYDVVITVTLKDTETFYKYLNVVPFYQNVKKDGVLIAG